MPLAGSPALSITDWIVLGVAAEARRHGFAIANELKADSQLGHVWTVHRPLVYRAIEHLEKVGLIERAGTEPGEHGPQRTLLRTTRAGRVLLQDWLAEPVKHPRDVRNELMAKFILLARKGEAIAPLAVIQLEEFAPLASGIANSAAEAKGADRLVALWRAESMQATVRLLQRVAAEEFSQ
jgi:DNA-binding PadR family transcriptional regulator